MSRRAAMLLLVNFNPPPEGRRGYKLVSSPCIGSYSHDLQVCAEQTCSDSESRFIMASFSTLHAACRPSLNSDSIPDFCSCQLPLVVALRDICSVCYWTTWRFCERISTQPTFGALPCCPHFAQSSVCGWPPDALPGFTRTFLRSHHSAR